MLQHSAHAPRFHRVLQHSAHAAEKDTRISGNV
jgi:hypothetical protein